MHPFESHIISELRSEDLLRTADRQRLAATVPRTRLRLFRRARRVRVPVTEPLPMPDRSVLDQIVAATAVPQNGAAS